MADRRPARPPSESVGTGSEGYSPRSTHATPKKVAWQPRFLEAFRASANVRLACQAAGIDRKTAYRERDKDAAFAEAWDSAKEDAVDTLEAVVFQRARQASDTLAIFLLKAHRPHVYRERIDIRIDASHAIERLTTDPDERAAALAEVESILRAGG